MLSRPVFFQRVFRFYFSGKIFIATNHLPAILDTSQGFWDRVKLIPFTVQIEPEKQIDKDTLIIRCSPRPPAFSHGW
jgi:phage/plasmid-associated DNA primase